jgi:hypothetical protein
MHQQALYIFADGEQIVIADSRWTLEQSQAARVEWRKMVARRKREKKPLKLRAELREIEETAVSA